MYLDTQPNPPGNTVLDRETASYRNPVYAEAEQKDPPVLWSDLLTLALDDMTKAMQRSEVFIDMGTWMTRTAHRCTVCMAGAVMLEEFGLPPVLPEEGGPLPGVDPYDALAPAHWPGAWAYAFRVINAMREGHVFENTTLQLPQKQRDGTIVFHSLPKPMRTILRGMYARLPANLSPRSGTYLEHYRAVAALLRTAGF